MAATAVVSRTAAVQAQEPPCAGTVLQLSINETGTLSIDRFRFHLLLNGEGDREEAAMDQLNQRLSTLRLQLNPLVSGTLTVPSPTTSRQSSRGDDKGRFVSIVRMSGEMKKWNYNTLIQSVGRLPGVRLVGMQSIPDQDDSETLKQSLMQAGLRRGKQEAERTAKSIGAARVKLIRINRNSIGGIPRPMLKSVSEDAPFRPDEAPDPEIAVRMQLDYCLF
ncbi:SIMPL domain-containing protein [Synechococcus sp. A15-127]|uniref:SIMPL domain-containing protein n=1 Tax=Synechococcus sp. A15-127 TaxID=1050624 RepID=UPI00164680AB|nr:SIMPL domain-containing protein [Synechococcus sp. A15-127]